MATDMLIEFLYVLDAWPELSENVFEWNLKTASGVTIINQAGLDSSYQSCTDTHGFTCTKMQ